MGLRVAKVSNDFTTLQRSVVSKGVEVGAEYAGLLTLPEDSGLRTCEDGYGV